MVKCFVGNLSFQTTEEQLEEVFSAAGTVVSAKIIKRGPRSLGYGFVDYDTEAEAQAAVDQLHESELDERVINVEIAKPRDESAEASKPRRRRRGGKRAEGEDGEEGEGGGRGRRRRGPRKPRLVREKKPSKTTLFIANIPFSLTDDGLADLFADSNPKAAHVVRKPNGNSKGYGFVEFSNEDDQQSALNAATESPIVIEEREIAVHVAQTEPIAPEELEAAEAAEAGPAEDAET